MNRKFSRFASAVAFLGILTLIVLWRGRGESSRQAENESRGGVRHSGKGDTTLHSIRILGDDDLFGRIKDLAVVDSGILVVDPLGEREKLWLLNRTTGEVIASSGRAGQGPAELQYPLSIDPSHGPNPSVWVYDFELGRLSSFRLDPLASEPEKVIRIQASLGEPVWVDKERLISNGLFPSEILRTYKSTGRYAALIGGAASSPYHDVGPEVGLHLNRTSMAVRPTRDQLAVAFVLSNKIHFYDMEGKLLRSVRGPKEVSPRYQVLWDSRNKAKRVVPEPETRFAYLDVAATNQYVFALFSGRSYGEYDDRAASADEIHVYTWNGDLAAVVKLSQEITRLTVDPRTGAVLGACEIPYPAVVEFESLHLPSNRSPKVMGHEGT